MRRTRKRRFRVLPRPAIAVRGLIEHAKPEELQKAHATCLLILDWWLGKKTKPEVAKLMGLPELRVWQLSQQGLSGMIAGLLKQPRPRRRGLAQSNPTDPTATLSCGPENDPVALKKAIRRLEQEVQAANRVNAVLRQFPFQQKATPSPEPKRGTKAKPSSRDKQPRPVGSRASKQASKASAVPEVQAG